MDQNSDQQILEKLRHISPEGLFQLGLPDIAYIRPINSGHRTVFALHTANGARISVLETRDAVEAAARENDLSLVSLH
jgi:hypothetical protein